VRRQAVVEVVEVGEVFEDGDCGREFGLGLLLGWWSLADGCDGGVVGASVDEVA
jgi:hypothetical protein